MYLNPLILDSQIPYSLVLHWGQFKGVQILNLYGQRYWEHGYASTIYSAQGKTVDQILIHVDTSQKSVMGHEAWYVAITRARLAAKVFTDHPENVPAASSRIMLQESAIEAREKFLGDEKQEKGRGKQKPRGRERSKGFDFGR